MKRQLKMNAVSFGILVELMLDGVYTCQQLAEETGLSYVTVLHYTRELHRKGACHIDHWEQDGRGAYMQRVYKIGRGKDAVRPSLTSAQRSARYRARLQAVSMVHAFAGPANQEMQQCA